MLLALLHQLQAANAVGLVARLGCHESDTLSLAETPLSPELARSLSTCLGRMH